MMHGKPAEKKTENLRVWSDSTEGSSLSECIVSQTENGDIYLNIGAQGLSKNGAFLHMTMIITRKQAAALADRLAEVLKMV